MSQTTDLPSQLSAVAQRYNQEYQGKGMSLPAEVESMPIFQDWRSGKLQGKITSPFWELGTPKKRERCLDLGCGISFLVYPWREWDAFFYGQDISSVARDALTSRAPQLNSKLFKGVRLKPAHDLDYEPHFFDRVFATGFSCYYSLEYWATVLSQVKKVLKPQGVFVFDVLDPEIELSENWAILETYLGAEVFLEPLDRWEAMIQSVGCKIIKKKPGTLFQLYQVAWKS
ncbi:MAG: class I SAM-dependent methyltransferase [Prochlorotrichaceae cyanobacterium]